MHVTTRVSIVRGVKHIKLSLVRTKPVHIWIIVSTSISTATL